MLRPTATAGLQHSLTLKLAAPTDSIRWKELMDRGLGQDRRVAEGSIPDSVEPANEYAHSMQIPSAALKTRFGRR